MFSKTEFNIEYDLLRFDKTIPKCYISDELYIPTDYKYLNLFNFENGLQFVVGSNRGDFDDFNDFNECLELDHKTFSKVSSASELQEYYYNEYDIFNKYEEIEKKFNYHKKWSKEIKEILEEYKH